MDDFAMWDELLDEDQIASLVDGSATPLTVSGGSPEFEITKIQLLQGGLIELTWNSKPNRNYSIFWSLDLAEFDAELEDGIPSQGDSTTHIVFDPSEIIDPPEPITKIFLRVTENP